MPHGQEIYLFFYRFGTKGLLGIIICNIIMAIIIYKTLKILYENNIKVLYEKFSDNLVINVLGNKKAIEKEALFNNFWKMKN